MKVAIWALLVPAVLAAWPPGYVKRGFHETKRGLLYYVTRGDVSRTPPLVFFHAHPRSSESFKEVALQLPASQPFIGIDYFGCGFSDECQCNEAEDEFVTYEEFAVYSMEICAGLGATKIIPFGSETGASPAIEVAALGAEKGLVDRAIFFEAMILKPAAKQFVDNVYIPSIRHLKKFANGSHVLYEWMRPDAGPIGPSSPIPAPEDFDSNEIKTIDALLASRTAWQFKMGWTAYNDKIPARLQQLSAKGVKFLMMYGEVADAVQNKYGLDHDWSMAHINAAIPEDLRTSFFVKNGGEGVLQQNATLVVDVINKFMGVPQDELVMV